MKDGKATGLRAGGQEYQFDLIIATVPSPIFLGMVPELPSDYAEKLADVRYQGAVVLAMTLKRQLTHIYWMNISDPAIPFIALVEHTNFVDPSVYGGKHILYVSNYLSLDSPLYSVNKEELLAHYLPHIQKFNPEFGEDWIEELFLFRDDAGQPVIGTNYSSRVPEHKTPITNLYLANTTQIYPEDRGMNYSVRLGRDVAKLVISKG